MSKKIQALLIALSKYFKDNPEVAKQLASLFNNESLIGTIQYQVEIHKIGLPDLMSLGWAVKKWNKTSLMHILNGDITEKDFK